MLKLGKYQNLFLGGFKILSQVMIDYIHMLDTLPVDCWLAFHLGATSVGQLSISANFFVFNSTSCFNIFENGENHTNLHKLFSIMFLFLVTCDK